MVNLDFSSPTTIAYIIGGFFGVVALVTLVFAIYFFASKKKSEPEINSLTTDTETDEKIAPVPVEDVEDLIHATVSASVNHSNEIKKEPIVEEEIPSVKEKVYTEELASQELLNAFKALPLGYKKQLALAIKDLNDGKKSYNVNFAYKTLLKTIKDEDERTKLAAVTIDYAKFNALILSNFKG